MLGLGPLAFTAPWLLLAGLILPAIWWLLRVTPPAPQRVTFPPLRFLQGLKAREETPARTPWWLMALRLIAMLALIVGLAGPVVSPGTPLRGSGPVLLVIDDGWPAAAGWPARRAAGEAVLDRAERAGRRVMLATTAPDRDGTPPSVSAPLAVSEARARLAALTPKPWGPDRGALADNLAASDAPNGTHSVWLSDGIALDEAAAAQATALMEALQRTGRLDLHLPGDGPATATRALYTLTHAQPSQDGLTATVTRTPRRTGRDDGAQLPARTVTVQGFDDSGRLRGRGTARFAAGARTADAELRLPLPQRNAVTRLTLAEARSAGATFLLDERARRRPVGVVPAAGAARTGQPLLRPSFYVEQALAGGAAVRVAALAELLADPPGMIVLTDHGRLAEANAQRLGDWVADGGVLVRFAGPALARAAAELNPERDLLPVPLHHSERELGGSLAWDTPKPLGSFAADSPLAGLSIPADVTVERQVLARPGAELAGQSWARLDDGTPLVTGTRRGDGWVVLVHSSAGPAWSDFALSGAYAAMLDRLSALGHGRSTNLPAQARLRPETGLDGFGRPTAPLASATALTGAGLNAARDMDGRAGDSQAPGGQDATPTDSTPPADLAAPRHPPGRYADADLRVAVNVADRAASPAALPRPPDGVALAGYAPSPALSLKPWFLTWALLVLLADFVLGLWLRGLLVGRGRRWRRDAAASLAALVAVGLLAAPPVNAQSQRDLAAANATWLGYIITGDPAVDARSEAGLTGLAETLTARTAIEPAGAHGLDPASDPLLFYPLIYWPVTAGQTPPSPEAASRIADYLDKGGMILFDTAEPLGFDGPGDPNAALQRLTAPLDLPPLQPVPEDHVLTRTFYLLSRFPGRYTGSELWIEAPVGDAAAESNVARVLVGAHDWAAAWARGADGAPAYTLSPGGERQRELARRFGVNLVTYALTGNYKLDQVHVPEILDRLER